MATVGASSSVTPQKRHHRRPTSPASPSTAERRHKPMSSTPTARPTPLALALQAQWTLLQQNIQLGVIPATAERDLLRVLESLPENKTTILSDVEGVLPYVLAFAVAPIPSERTQVIALGAMQAIVGSLTTVWGKKAAAVLVHDFLTVEHNALHALGVTLSVALDDDAPTAEDVVMEMNRGKSTKTPGRMRDATLTETRSSIVGGALEFLLMIVTLSAPTAAAVLTHPKLIQALLCCLTQATPTQACDVANILLTLSSVEGAAEVLVAYRAYHSVLHYIRTGVRGGAGVSQPNATMTALCLFLRFAVRLAGNSAAFAILQEAPTVPQVMEELLRSQWGEFVTIACQWLATIMEQQTSNCVGFMSDMLLKTRVGEQLSSMLLWSSNMGQYAVKAALCWRWFSLVAPAAAGSFLVSNPNALFSLVQSLATTPLSPPPPPPQQQKQKQKQRKSLSHEKNVFDPDENTTEGNTSRQLLIEVTCALGICHGLVKKALRAAMRRVILHRLSPVTQEEVQKRVVAVFAGVEDSYFDGYPTVTLPHRNANTSQHFPSDRHLMESATETEDDVSDEVTERQRHVNDSDGVYSLCTGAHWRRFMLRSLTRLFHGSARGTVKSFGSVAQRRLLGAATALRRIPNSCGARQNPYDHRALTADINTNTTAMTKTMSVPQLGVVQRAEEMGGMFYLDCIRVILRLAHHYKHASAKRDATGAGACRLASTRSLNRGGKAPNPWAPPQKVESTRCWGVEEVQRPDVVLFCVSYDNIVAELAEALLAVAEHTKRLGEQLQLCPTRALQRRCVLNDLYLHVYPTIHMCLRFIQHHIARSRPVLQIIAENERAVHSGNILDLYEAVGHCVEGGAPSSWDTTIENRLRGGE
ncbi:hypothetical protein TraAM80_05408 [Trypanosoma rangeli]|uniref:Uncharacterized protein n=1 Tax=Trypanosoma rangeli TaxID=5698 RepID=A0A422NER1_TRYRA|nr:uncharacterized protein TraAM80_05408 [Trypanosoma rangeli]RNF03954.1 hypothetical protein TraAM80_05408 [Trypanosoma rangeli]|eukprot:RNF03954.1 hypothetical protein TraAM80_05408 [Trypanosoma rangeli]